jgi:hypothetical protein
MLDLDTNTLKHIQKLMEFEHKLIEIFVNLIRKVYDFKIYKTCLLNNKCLYH